MTFWQSMLLDPIYRSDIAVDAVLTTVANDDLNIRAMDRTRPSSFTSPIGVDFQAFRPTAMVRMSELAGLTIEDDVQGGQIAMNGRTWSIKSFEYVATPEGNPGGELRLILKDDINVTG